MANISASMVKELREKTSVGMMECKKALVENDGDIEKAIVWLREKGIAKAGKKAGRIAAEGMVKVMCSDDHTYGTMVEVNCETDFAARNDEFIGMVDMFANHAMKTKATDIEAFKASSMDGQTVGDKLTAVIAKVGENMTLRRVTTLMTNSGVVAGYMHMGGKIGTLVAIENPSDKDKALEVGKDLAMHAAAANPKYLNSAEVPEAEANQEKEIARAKLKDEGKPDNIIEKILTGAVAKYYKEVCLLDQPFVKDPKSSVSQWFKSAGCGGEIKGFTRFQLGEGIEKKTENFADEVAAQLKK